MSPSRDSYLSIFFRIPPERYCSGSTKEGWLYQNFKKSNFKTESSGNYYEGERNHPYSFLRCRYRKSSSIYDLEKGACRAWKYNDKVHLDFIDNSNSSEMYEEIYHQYNTLWVKKSSLEKYKESDHRNLALPSRYIYHDGWVYWGYIIALGRCEIRNSSLVELFVTDRIMGYLETTRWGHSESPYEIDFFIEDGNNGKKIFVYLAFVGAGNYSPHTSSYNWSSTYCNWTVNYATLCLKSLIRCVMTR